MKIQPLRIQNTEKFFKRVFGAAKDETSEFFYRGHSDSAFTLVPRIMRRRYFKENEDRLFREMLILHPSDFGEDVSTLEMLVRMQHHSLPTRLLDITSNPLMALYFACKHDADTDGEVLILKLQTDDIKFYDSDTASCLANLAKLNNRYKSKIDPSQDEIAFNKSDPNRGVDQEIRRKLTGHNLMRSMTVTRGQK